MITHDELLAAGAPKLDAGLKYKVSVDEYVGAEFPRQVRVCIVQANLSFWQKLMAPDPLGVAHADLKDVLNLDELDHPDALLGKVVDLCHQAVKDSGVRRKYQAALAKLQS